MCRERSLSSVWGGFEVKPEEVNENKVVSLHQPHKQVGGGWGGGREGEHAQWGTALTWTKLSGLDSWQKALRLRSHKSRNAPVGDGKR